MAIEKGLVERNANLYQVPEEVDFRFDGDTNIRPVRPNSVTYLPMRFEILGPKIDVDLEAIQAYNLTLFQNQANDPNAVGETLSSAGSLLDEAELISGVIDNLNEVPPLVLYINPTEITRTFAKHTTEQLGGNGHIIEHWGDEQDRLSASGKIGAYYTDKTGLSRYFRRNSASFQQLMQLYIMYRNNGYIYEVYDARRISLVGRVQISYDTETWIGHFDSFQMTENADNPFTMEYSFDFTVREYYNNVNLTQGGVPDFASTGQFTRSPDYFAPELPRRGRFIVRAPGPTGDDG